MTKHINSEEIQMASIEYLNIHNENKDALLQVERLHILKNNFVKTDDLYLTSIQSARKCLAILSKCLGELQGTLRRIK
jgi:hypothetical protein